jgi:hypothetical protein
MLQRFISRWFDELKVMGEKQLIFNVNANPSRLLEARYVFEGISLPTAFGDFHGDVRSAAA